MCEFERGVAFDQWVPNVSEVPLGVLINDFVRWLCGPWVAFGHWRTYLSENIIVKILMMDLMINSYHNGFNTNTQALWCPRLSNQFHFIHSLWKTLEAFQMVVVLYLDQHVGCYKRVFVRHSRLGLLKALLHFKSHQSIEYCKIGREVKWVLEVVFNVDDIWWLLTLNEWVIEDINSTITMVL
jgi:hypothetical protein